jgi:hypothetical protein
MQDSELHVGEGCGTPARLGAGRYAEEDGGTLYQAIERGQIEMPQPGGAGDGTSAPEGETEGGEPSD